MPISALQRLVPDAPQALLFLLDPTQGAVLPPIRSEIFGPERFAQHGRSLGLTHDAALQPARHASFFPRFRSNVQMLRHAYAYIGAQAATGYDISPAAEWLLDNFHLIEAQLKAVREGLPRSYFRALPVLLSEPLAGLPRVYGVAWAFVAHTDSAFDEDLLLRYLIAYQDSRTLNLSEMWALPTTLRVVLVENLRRLAERLASHKAARELANLCSDRAAQLTVPALEALVAELQARAVAPVFLAKLAQRLQDRVALPAVRASAEVLAWLQTALPDGPALQAQQNADQAADNLSVSNAVTSLRAIASADWPDIVARGSTLMSQLLAAPLFAAEDSATRDQTLHGIESLARRSQRSEQDVARELLRLMAPAPPTTAAADPDAASAVVAAPAAVAGRQHTAPYWLRGKGRRQLALALGLRDRWWRVRAWAAPRAVLPLYLLCLAGLTAGVLLAVVANPVGAGWAGWASWAFALLLLGPASEAVVALVNRLISESVPPQHLSRLALAGGIPPEHRVLVVVPALLGSVQGAAALWHRLRLHHLANPEDNAQFALLSDWHDAPTEQLDSDPALLAATLAQLEELNALHPRPGPAPRFVLLHRHRTFSVSEQAWIGWERKRGKLEQLVAALATGDNSAFIDLGQASQLQAGTPYIVTLDADTELPPGRLRELVGVAAHPHNQPRVDPLLRRVVAGHAILQPRLVTPLPAAGQATLFHRLFAGQCGVDPYSAASSEVYQDLFGEGSFSGKGLLHVAALHQVLHDRLPQEQVLSHDLLEGSLARCAVVTDITLVEDAPNHADVAAARLHRWTRGDWQLLPLLLQPRRFALRGVHRWKMLDNLRRSLVAPLSLAAVLLALAGAGPSLATVLVLVLAAFVAGPVMGAVAGLAPSRDDIALWHFYRQAGADLARALLGGLWHLAMLLQQAVQSLDAVARALWRTLHSRRHLLQWTTAAAAHASAQRSLPALWRQHAATSALAALMLAALLLADTPTPGAALALCLLWALAPLWTWWVSRAPADAAARRLPRVDEAYLQNVARDTWRYFERCVTAEDQHLPPDNLQTTPHDMLAHRTSPTNIGLYLLSVACAQRLGFITVAELLDRLEATLASVARLERYRGHLLNWYDTQTLQPLLPRYVSTVDSGNFSGHVLALAQGCAELARATPVGPEQSRLLALVTQCEQMAWQAEFGFLYSRRRHLLHIGFRVAEQQLDAGFYDLLASESRLTSLLAIAKGDVPMRHWAALGRPFYALGAVAGLRSWSGSMFEYLMPSLVLEEPPDSALSQACQVALQEQIDFVAQQQMPWGISESAYAGCDHTLAYQYAPQGVPRLALRRTPPDERVIAPYATALAALIDPRRAALNLAALQALGARDTLGFIEALDYTPGVQAGPERFTRVNTFMAHHQGMTLVALSNVLLGGLVQRWGMASAPMEAVASLLHERAPREVSLLHVPTAGQPAQAAVRRLPALLREVLPGQQAVEPTQLLSNGRYSVTLRANGAGGSRLGALGITRQRDDALRDACGSFFYIRRRAGDTPVSVTQHPAPDPAASYCSVFHADRVCFDATWPELKAHVTVWVSPEDDIEFRQVELHNTSHQAIEIELMSAFEVTLADPQADEAHPAFGGLFVQAEWRAEQQALLFQRTPRLATETGLQMAHFLAQPDPQDVTILGLQGQTDRARWLGRNRAVSQPLAELHALPGEGAGSAAAPAAGPAERTADTSSPDTNRAQTNLVLDTGLDPVCVLAVRVRIAPMAKAELTFATAASADPTTLRSLVDKYRQPSHVQRASLMSATLASIRLRALRISAENFAAVQLLTTALVQGLSQANPDAASAALAHAGQRRRLWRLGISGDRPVLLVSALALQGVGLLRTLAQALRLWAWGGIACDLVVVNTEPASYLMPLQHDIALLRDQHNADGAVAAAIGFHLLRADELDAGELATLQALARLSLVADGRSLVHHVQDWVQGHERARERRQEVSTAPLAAGASAAQRALPASVGQFASDDGAFSFVAGASQRPRRPWVNVLANPGFGCHVSEAGPGCIWAHNSRLHRLTDWSNDPVADPPAQWLWLQDRRSRQAWSATASAFGAAGVDYRVQHGIGTTRIEHQRGDLQVQLAWCVDLHSPVLQLKVRLHNRGRRALDLRVVAGLEWLMGSQRMARHQVRTALHRQRLAHGKLSTLCATQFDATDGLAGSTAWLALTAPDAQASTGSLSDDHVDWTCDRREFFDACGGPVLPDHLGRQQGAGLDPCAAWSLDVDLAPGQEHECVFLVGHSVSLEAAHSDAAVAAAALPSQRLAQVQQHWQDLLGATQVRTPDPLFNALVNHWLLYQAVSCRLWAKAGFYQAGGATGYRDQLQDTLALAWAQPQRLREQIVRCASRQFVEGDVQHWWHEPGGAGVRTHFSDDLLWLPHALLHYLRATADHAVLDESVPFLEGPPIAPGAEDHYDTPQVSEQHGSVYEHAARTLDRSLRVGVHGLPLMGSGDWNDGMNRVGAEGRGESVWLAWFLCPLVAGMAPLAQARGDHARAQRWLLAAQGWQAALQGPAWDGQWYVRAFFDNGQPLGSHANPQARIDLIAQAWAVLSGVAPVPRQLQAMASAREQLVDEQAGLLRLLHPPLSDAEPSAGYIQAYPAGVRENGGQYTHGAVWALMAQAALQAAGHAPRSDLPYRWWTWLSPAHRSADAVQGPAYGLEPYVVAGDVYSMPPYTGRGGWSWYSGAASWLHRAAVESILGLNLSAHGLSLTPSVPADWPRAEITLRRGERTVRIVILQAQGAQFGQPQQVDAAPTVQDLPADVVKLRVGESVDWTRLPLTSCLLVRVEVRVEVPVEVPPEVPEVVRVPVPAPAPASTE